MQLGFHLLHYNLVMFRADGLFNEVFDDGDQAIHLVFLFTQSQRRCFLITNLVHYTWRFPKCLPNVSEMTNLSAINTINSKTKDDCSTNKFHMMSLMWS